MRYRKYAIQCMLLLLSCKVFGVPIQGYDPQTGLQLPANATESGSKGNNVDVSVPEAREIENTLLVDAATKRVNQTPDMTTETPNSNPTGSGSLTQIEPKPAGSQPAVAQARASK
ncbi:hypothetical protein ABW19_dt0200389 [Dactylella cylindrospora]|nr:hypothetical protein ABW19_dt0200389 [Dactylella cylindrospora]